ncbi:MULTISPECIES: hypothetical protein [Rhizobium]|uniref:Uncharacterized protein n=2 Tax=Rhizobium grahamii TaxID=1120045 RepID=S3HFD0_9HYPH|nr:MULTISPECIES: hypothetical protein [Rhizobium]EPE97489.1 hypothetical protein RGCCGE502_15640 [Rhizobium grahamii CCGE 502]MBB3316786.1 hypothetical protein [Rhizobium sp. BK181]MBB3541367.1 hypothetical protein [Rhizobium sp. BK399]MCS3740092.1 hypothetical protein [Rhizobium sp. BK661]MCS4091958.1 hypothetical protein [Rhizobium sp. BK176]
MLPVAKEDVDFEVQAALAWHDDDVNATIATLLEDIRHLRQQLSLAKSAMSRGITRGWAPQFERK